MKGEGEGRWRLERSYGHHLWMDARDGGGWRMDDVMLFCTFLLLVVGGRRGGRRARPASSRPSLIRYGTKPFLLYLWYVSLIIERRKGEDSENFDVHLQVNAMM